MVARQGLFHLKALISGLTHLGSRPTSCIRALPTIVVVEQGLFHLIVLISITISTLAVNALTTTTVMQLPAQMDSSRSEFITALFIDALFSILLRFHLLQSLIICMHLYYHTAIIRQWWIFAKELLFSLFFRSALDLRIEARTDSCSCRSDSRSHRQIYICYTDYLLNTYVFVQQILYFIKRSLSAP